MLLFWMDLGHWVTGSGLGSWVLAFPGLGSEVRAESVLVSGSWLNPTQCASQPTSHSPISLMEPRYFLLVSLDSL
ncbi:hypothetical protein GGS21DRAFT_518359 [Xylaria nigripes]|nr:hypothetical protein GGS21DRAFT_518359 [Xylaria nigripes]